MSIPKVAVWFVAYNHAPYVAKAIESVLMQKTDFDFRIFIGEDCSTDRTGEICKEYQAKYPEKIDLKQHRSNIGSVPNGIDTYLRCFKSEAEYIALLEGDDYWTDPYKLQKQVNILKSNPEYAICFHKIKKIDHNNNFLSIQPQLNKNEFTLNELISNSFHIPTLSCVFRKNFTELPDWFPHIMPGDRILHILNAQYGKIFYVDEVMGTYRKHSTGIYSNENRLKSYKRIIETYDIIDKHFNFRYTLQIKKVKIDREIDFIRILIKSKNWNRAFIHILKFCKNYPLHLKKLLFTGINKIFSVKENSLTVLHKF